MNLDIIGNGIMTLVTLAGFLYASIRFFRPKQALLKKLLASSLGCLLIGRLYEIVQFVVAKGLPPIFQIGIFAYIGCFMFLFCINYGEVDSLIDDGTEGVKKYRWIALAAPLIFTVSAVIVVLAPMRFSLKIFIAFEQLAIAASSYFSLKHLIVPKRYSGFLSSMRLFHIVSLVLAVGVALENVFWAYDVNEASLWVISYVPQWIAVLTIAPVLDWGTKKWII